MIKLKSQFEPLRKTTPISLGNFILKILRAEPLYFPV